MQFQRQTGGREGSSGHGEPKPGRGGRGGLLGGDAVAGNSQQGAGVRSL